MCAVSYPTENFFFFCNDNATCHVQNLFLIDKSEFAGKEMEALLYRRAFLLISLFATFIFNHTHGNDKQESFGAEMD